jgi:hypothetical protein
MKDEANGISQNHPLRKLFRSVADWTLSQASLLDKDLLLYLSDFLIHFIYTNNLNKLKGKEGKNLEYLVDMCEGVGEAPRSHKKAHYQQIGDHTLFMLGMVPESLTRGKRTISPSYYADTGRRNYMAASQLEEDEGATVVFRKLSERYERCVVSLNWVRDYINDPFYQFMLRQDGITP